MKILIWSDAPWVNTGYGGQVRELCRRLPEMGHEVAVCALFGLQGAALNWRNVTVYPRWEGELGEDVVGYYARHFDADVVLSLYDVWALPRQVRQTLPCPWVAWVPVDGAPLSPEQVAILKTVDYPVAISRFGQREMDKADVACDYIPLGIDTDVFRPGDKEAARAFLGIPQDRYMVAVVASNKGYPPRKGWPEMMTAYTRFWEDHPEALLYLHTTRHPRGSRGIGVYFEALFDALDLPQEAYTYVPEGALAVGVPDATMAAVYQASDVMLLPSMGEGFGLPVVEAQACGCPVITQDCSAMSELTVNGIAVKPLQPLWLPQLKYWWQLPDVEAVTQALETVYSLAPSRESWYVKSAQGVEFVRSRYAWDVVMEQYWGPGLERVEATLW